MAHANTDQTVPGAGVGDELPVHDSRRPPLKLILPWRYPRAPEGKQWAVDDPRETGFGWRLHMPGAAVVEILHR
jgi:hypothetical protein